MTQPASGGTPLIPAQPDATNTPWARPGPTEADPATTRARRYVEDLPGWEPLPPGEITVHRRRH